MTDFTEPFLAFTRSAFRLETLPEYRVDYEEAMIADYLSGKKVEYDNEYVRWWLDMVHDKTSNGLSMSRVHVVSQPLTDYLRFELGVAYPKTSAAGEEIRLINDDDFDDLCDEDEFDVAFNRWGSLDFWLFDDSRLFIMDYDDDGKWLGQNESFDEDDIKDAMRIRDAVMTGSSPFISGLGAAFSMDGNIDRTIDPLLNGIWDDLARNINPVAVLSRLTQLVSLLGYDEDPSAIVAFAKHRASFELVSDVSLIPELSAFRKRITDAIAGNDKTGHALWELLRFGDNQQAKNLFGLLLESPQILIETDHHQVLSFMEFASSEAWDEMFDSRERTQLEDLFAQLLESISMIPEARMVIQNRQLRDGYVFTYAHVAARSESHDVRTRIDAAWARLGLEPLEQDISDRNPVETMLAVSDPAQDLKLFEYALREHAIIDHLRDIETGRTFPPSYVRDLVDRLVGRIASSPLLPEYVFQLFDSGHDDQGVELLDVARNNIELLAANAHVRDFMPVLLLRIEPQHEMHPATHCVVQLFAHVASDANATRALQKNPHINFIMKDLHDLRGICDEPLAEQLDVICERLGSRGIDPPGL